MDTAQARGQAGRGRVSEELPAQFWNEESKMVFADGVVCAAFCKLSGAKVFVWAL